MMHLLMNTFLASLPPEVRKSLEAMKDSLEKTGSAEGVFPVPNVGNCKVTIVKLPEGQ